MTDYSLAEKILHYVALQSRFTGQMLFDIERSIYLKAAPNQVVGKHVFVSGLARSGTTILMRAIYNSDQFASLTYKDMPFVLCPNLWRAVTNRYSRKPFSQERAHGDGIIVDFNSPEALDEVFWKVFSGEDYIKEYGLVPYNPSAETLNSFSDYVRLILHSRNKSRYLSKNNNNILRISAIKSIFPNAIFIIPIRDPLTHSWSLLSQHQRFSTASVFTKRYMTWLVHHEFGATQKPFIFNSTPQSLIDSDELLYWVELWFNCYEYLSQFINDTGTDIYFVPYESLCTNKSVWYRLAELIGIDTDVKSEFRQNKVSLDAVSDSRELQRANELYLAIKAQSLKKLGI